MRILPCVLGVCLAWICVGCSNRNGRPSDGHYRVAVETVCEGRDLMITRLSLTFAGTRSVKLFEDGGSETATVGPVPGSDLGACDILLLADAVNVGDTHIIKWLHQIRGSGVTVGGPSIHPATAGQPLDEVLHVLIKPGEMTFGTEIDVATFRGQTLRMVVE